MKPKLVRITTVPISLDKLITNQMKFMSDYYEVIAVSSDKKNLEKVAKSQKVAFKAIEMSRQITPIKDVISLIKMIIFLLKEKPLIVHTHTPKAGIIGMLAAKIAGVPIRLHTVAGLPLMEAVGLKRKVLNAVEKLTYAAATRVYPNSKGLESFIIQNKFTNSNKIKVLGQGSSNGIDTHFFNKNKGAIELINKYKLELGIQPDDFVFIFVGRLVSDKGINEMVQAFQQISIQYNHAKLLLVGPLETDLDPLKPETLLAINTNKSIISVGYQQDVRPFFEMSNALLFPSYREGFPNVVMQAGAMNLPCIVSDINGCNEIIIHQVNGLIIPVKDTHAIKNAMIQFLSNSINYQLMATKSRELIAKRYEQRYIWEQILKEYKDLQANVQTID